MNSAAGRGRGWMQWLGIAVALFTIVTALSAVPLLRELQLRLTDSYVQLAPTPHQRSPVVLVMIDDASLNRYGRWPWSRTLLARMTRNLTDAGAQVIGLDILLAESQDAGADTDLSAAMADNRRTVIVDKIGNYPDGPRWVEPLPEFTRAAVATGHAQAVLDRDGICRHFPPIELSAEGARWAFSLELARRIDPRAAALFLRSYGVSAQDNLRPVEIAKPVLIPIAFRRDQFDTLSATAVLEGSAAQVAGRPVIVGFGPTDIADRVSTPLTGSLPAPGVEVHAQILDSILTGRQLHPVPAWLQVLVLLAVSVAVTGVSRQVRGWIGVLLLFGFAVSVYAGGLAMFVWASRIVPLGPSMLALVIGPLLVYTADFFTVERSLNRQLRELGRWLAMRPQPSPSNGRGLSWSLDLLQDLHTRLGATYELHQALLEASNDLVAVFGEDGRLLLHNQRFSAAFDAAADVAWETFRAAVLPGTAAEAAASGGWEVEFNDDLYSVRVVPLPATTLSPAGGTLVTLTSQQARLERDRARAEALGFVTHELRTPLAAIQNFAELMMRYPESPLYGNAPETIFREAKRLLALINSYLDVLRLDAGARPLRLELFPLGQIVREVFEILRPLADAANMRLSFHENAPHPIVADAPLLTGAVLNLVSNAIKYGKPRSEIVVRCRRSDNETILSVRNLCEPIASAEIPRLFDPFYRTAKPDVVHPGWGLGLAFVKRIAEKHGGSVAVASDGSGTTFEIRLPLEVAAARAGGAA